MSKITIDNTIQRIIVNEKHRLEFNLGRKVTMNDALRYIIQYGVVYQDYKILDSKNLESL